MAEITITPDTDDVATYQGAVADALFALEAVSDTSPELTTLHEALSDLQDYYQSLLPEVHRGTFQPMSGGDKPPKTGGGGS